MRHWCSKTNDDDYCLQCEMRKQMAEKLYTIDELMEGKKPGEILIVAKDGHVFRPYYRDDNMWYGLSDLGRHSPEFVSNEYWTLYTEPKKKVKRWLWACKKEHTVSHGIGPNYHKSCFYAENEISSSHYTKLPWSETEFEE